MSVSIENKSLRILVVSQYFWPESFIINDLVRVWTKAGHYVEVLTGKPNYPDGKIFSGYTSHGYTNEVFDHAVKIHRVPLYPRGNNSARSLIRNYISFVWNGLFYSKKIKKDSDFDVIFVMGLSPPMSAIPAIWLKTKLKVPVVIWVQDLWPESLSATGFVKNKFVLKLVNKIVGLIYKNSNLLLVQSQSFINPVSRYVDKKKIRYFPNFCIDQVVNQTSQDSISLDADAVHALKNDFSIVFAGNLGSAQALETIVDAAKLLKDTEGIKIILVGSGSKSSWLEKEKIEKKLTNLVLPGRVSAEEMPKIFNLADALLVTLKKDLIFSYTIPSKIQSYLAAGRPIIAALEGEGAKVVAAAGAGLICPAEDAQALADCIFSMFKMDLQQRAEMGQRGRSYFLDNFELNKQSFDLIEILKSEIIKG